MKKIFIIYIIGIIISSFFYFYLDEKEEIDSASQNLIKKKNIIQEKKSFQNKRKITIWEYIAMLAEKKGYFKYKELSIKKDGEILEWKYVRIGVKEDFLAMKKEMKKNNLKLNLISAFRSINRQKNIFEKKINKVCKKNDDILKGKCDNEINNILEVSSPPRYSKHHTGRALDFSCGNDYSLNYNFKKTKCYEWLAKNNFKNSKKYNFIPSYPEGIKRQGPLPEPWEFIWIR